MMAALTFATPALLIGLAAAAIPFVLHLLSSVRAQEVYFPTLRFLRMSMEKTARRRRIQHWLLLLLRAVLLALLALAVAEPISEAVGGLFGGRRYVAAIVLDNSMSMAARDEQSSPFARAQGQVQTLLSGRDAPSVAALYVTNDSAAGAQAPKLTAQLQPLHNRVAQATTRYDRALIDQCLVDAVKLLADQSEPQKSIYVFSDLQRASFEDLLRREELASDQARDIHLLIVNTAIRAPINVGVAALELSGQAIVNRPVKFSAKLVNSSPTDRTVEAVLRVQGKPAGPPVRQRLAAAGRKGSSALVHFTYAFPRPGPVTGEVFLNVDDDLPLDNVRRFSLQVGGRIRALVVRSAGGPGEPTALQPGRMLMLALHPFPPGSPGMSIRPTAVSPNGLTAEALRGADIVFLAEVPSFAPAQAEALAEFVAAGGTAVFFLGPRVVVDNYNDVFVGQIAAEGGLLPGRLAPPVGDVGPEAHAEATDWVDVNHPFLQGLYANQADYLGTLVQRRFRLAAAGAAGRVLMRLADGDPLLVVKDFGAGRVVLCTTTCEPRWTTLPTEGLFVALVRRMSLLSRREFVTDHSYLPGAQVTIRPRPPAGDQTNGGAANQPASVVVTLPPTADEPTGPTSTLPLRETDGTFQAAFTDTAELGVYRWLAKDADGRDVDAGAFVVNPNGVESDLQPVSPAPFLQALRGRKLTRVYVGSSVGEVHAEAAAGARGRNFWDLLAAVAIFVLVVEALVANRRRREQVIPAHLNPRLAA